ncbi:Beta-ketoacyl synthase [Parafrankia sp. EAN1pec]|uniref:type I polyketide synthase n=1 Tax=Parafrankia sp. (strain EAN1pec) TaxID=298653 RepID=UPI0000543805|nr:Beta-ketoacyl synthase [Frankia sp. EAN1pec]
MSRESVTVDHLRPTPGSPESDGVLLTRLLREKYEPVAVVGMGLRLPGGSESPDEFEDFLRAGRSGVGPLPKDRWDPDLFVPDDPSEKGKIQTTGGGFLDRIDLFDAPFFNISPKEAQYVDPQQRLLLETAWHALEHANIDPTPLRRGNGGVYVGASSIDYALELDGLPYEALDGLLASGISMFPLSGRLSYFLGWRGPSVSVDTACSSSLSALHLAVEGLRRRECDLALCGGVNALHHPRIMVMFSHGQMLAPDGQCKTFDDAADGYVRAEGCGVLVLKRLSDAERDGDTVLALIRGTAIGQDGDSAGLTVPNGPAQELVIRRAIAAARLEPRDIQYVEAHGTGTPIGDPIELGAVNDVFSASHTHDDPLLVGSVKTNIGHTEPLSGLVGVIKTVLQLRAGTIFPHLNFHQPSSRIPWDVYPVRVPTELEPWPGPVRRAVVNSFGFAGTIAAAVVEQAPRPDAPAAGELAGDKLAGDEPAGDEAAPLAAVFTLSGKNEAALRRQAESYRQFVEASPELDVERLCYTSNVGRAHFSHRQAGVVTSRADLEKLLGAESLQQQPALAKIRKVGFLFSGQGSQYPGMGAYLYRRFAEFRRQVDECDRLFAPHLDTSVRALLLGESGHDELIDQTRYTQPALFTLEYALARLWTSWNVRPNVLIGHSIGEVAAAAVAELFDLPDAVLLVASRARLMQSVRTPGGMAAVGAAPELVAPMLDEFPGLALAAVNAPGQCVVSGARDELAALGERLRLRGLSVEPLAVSHAFHSPLMAEVAAELRAAVAGVTFREPSIPLVSNVTGQLARFAEIGTPDYWVRHVREPVLFMAGLRAVEKRGQHAFVEIGPSTSLTALARQCLPADDHRWIASLRRRDPSAHTVLHGLAELYAGGVAVSWAGVHAGRTLSKIELPGYAFARKRYWLPVDGGPSSPGSAAGYHPLLGQEQSPGERRPGEAREFVAEYSPERPAYLADHPGPDGEVVVPVAAYVELLLALQDAAFGHTRGTISDLRVQDPLRLVGEGRVQVRTRLSARADGRFDVVVSSGRPDQPTPHASAVLAEEDVESAVLSGVGAALRDRARSPGAVEDRVSHEDLYTDLAAVGREYGERFRLVAEVRGHSGGLLTGTVAGRPATVVEHLPPELLECALQAVAALHPDGPVLVSSGVGRLRLFRKPRAEHLRVVARLRRAAVDRWVADVVLFEDEVVVAELREVRLGAAGVSYPFLHRLAWLRRTAPPQLASQPRHVLVLGREPGDSAAGLAEPAAADGVRTTFLAAAEGAGGVAGALGDPTVTDLCWFWRSAQGETTAASLRNECELNYRALLELVAVLNAADLPRPPRLWLVTKRAQWLPGDEVGTGEQLAAATLWGFGHALLNEYPRYRACLVDVAGDADLAGLVEQWQAPDTGEFQLAYRRGRRYVRRLLAGERTPDWDGGFVVRPAAAGVVDEMTVEPVDEPAPVGDQVQVRVRLAALDGSPPAVAPPAATDTSGETTDTSAATDTPGATTDTPAVAEPPDGRDALPAVAAVGWAGTVVAAGDQAAFAVGDHVAVTGPGTVSRTVTVPSSAATALSHGNDLADALAALVRAATPGARAAGPAGTRQIDRVELYDLDEVPEALAAARRDTGPVVALVQVGPEPVAAVEPAVAVRVSEADAPPAPVRPDRVYLVTGGLGGLGLVTAQKLVDLGAKRLVLTSRSGRPTPEATDVLAALSDRAVVSVERADVGSAPDVERLVELVRQTGLPLGGIVHAAGVAGKSLIGNLTWEAVDEQLRAQVYGGWLLHEASLGFPELDFFLAHSSVAAVVGGATQAHYAAAFAFLDGLVAWRARQGLPALAVNWGAWGRVGMSARLDENLGRELRRSGIRLFSPGRALRTLPSLLTGAAPNLVAGVFDWDRYIAPSLLDNALYSRVARGRVDLGGGFDVAALLAKSPADRSAALAELVLDLVGAALHLDDGERVDPAAEFVALGLDSLMALEVKTSLEGSLRLPLPATLTFDHPSPRQLAEFLDGQLAATTTATSATATSATATSATATSATATTPTTTATDPDARGQAAQRS